MNPNNLSEKQNVELDKVLKLNKPLSKAYILKEELRILWGCKDIATGEKYLNEWIEKSKLTQMKQMAKTLTKYKKGVLNYFKHSIGHGKLAGHRLSTGPIEGMNNKIKRMLRITYGLRDEEYLRLKIYNL